MQTKIDEKAFVPIGWVFTAFGAMISVSIVGSFWVSTVNFRLQRIEEKLGIPSLKTTSEISEALAGEKKNDDAKRLHPVISEFRADRGH